MDTGVDSGIYKVLFLLHLVTVIAGFGAVALMGVFGLQAKKRRGDEDLLAAATADGRALVTENAKDFALLDRRWAAAGKSHAGLVFTHPRRFPRSGRSYAPRLAGALARFVEEHGHGLRAVEAFVWWLDVRRPDR